MHAIKDFREVYKMFLFTASELAKNDKFHEAEVVLLQLHKKLEKMILENKAELENRGQKC